MKYEYNVSSDTIFAHKSNRSLVTIINSFPTDDLYDLNFYQIVCGGLLNDLQVYFTTILRKNY